MLHLWCHGPCSCLARCALLGPLSHPLLPSWAQLPLVALTRNLSSRQRYVLLPSKGLGSGSCKGAVLYVTRVAPYITGSLAFENLALAPGTGLSTPRGIFLSIWESRSDPHRNRRAWLTCIVVKILLLPRVWRHKLTHALSALLDECRRGTESVGLSL